jgi:hypothetical protein
LVGPPGSVRLVVRGGLSNAAADWGRPAGSPQHPLAEAPRLTSRRVRGRCRHRPRPSEPCGKVVPSHGSSKPSRKDVGSGCGRLPPPRGSVGYTRGCASNLCHDEQPSQRLRVVHPAPVSRLAARARRPSPPDEVDGQLSLSQQGFPTTPSRTGQAPFSASGSPAPGYGRRRASSRIRA